MPFGGQEVQVDAIRIIMLFRIPALLVPVKAKR